MKATTSKLDLAQIESLCNRFAKVSVAIVNLEPEDRFQSNLFAVFYSDSSGARLVDEVLPMHPAVLAFMEENGQTAQILQQVARAVFDGDATVSDKRAVPDALVFVAECWIVTATAAEAELARSIKMRPQDHPRRERTLVTAVYVPHGVFVSMCPVTGEGSERRATFEPFDRESVAMPWADFDEVSVH